MFLTGKYKDSVGQKASLECVKSIYVRITEAACVTVSDKVMPFKKEEKEVGQIVSLGDSYIKRVRDRIAILSS